MFNNLVKPLTGNISEPGGGLVTGVTSGHAPRGDGVGLQAYLHARRVWYPSQPEEEAFDKYFAAGHPKTARPHFWQNFEKCAKGELKQAWAQHSVATTKGHSSSAVLGLFAQIYDGKRSGQSFANYIDAIPLWPFVTMVREAFGVSGRKPIRQDPTFSSSCMDAFWDGIENRDKLGYLRTGVSFSGDGIQVRGKWFDTTHMRTSIGGQGWGSMVLSARKHTFGGRLSNGPSFFYAGRRPHAATTLVGESVAFDVDVMIRGGSIQLSLYTGLKAATASDLQLVLRTMQEQGMNLYSCDVLVWMPAGRHVPPGALLVQPKPDQSTACRIKATAFLEACEHYPNPWHACP